MRSLGVTALGRRVVASMCSHEMPDPQVCRFRWFEAECWHGIAAPWTLTFMESAESQSAGVLRRWSGRRNPCDGE